VKQNTQTPSTPTTEALIGTSTLAVTGQTPAAGWLPISSDRWYSTDGRYVLVQLPGGLPVPTSLRARLRALFTGGSSAAQSPLPATGFLPEVEAAARWSEPVAWTPTKADVGARAAWLGVDIADRDVVLPTCSRSATGQLRVHHGLVTGRTGTGKGMTVQNLLLPGLSAGTEIVLIADGLGNSLPDLEPYITRRARRDPLEGAARWEQVITWAWQIMRSRQERGWGGPVATDPVITLLIDGSELIKNSIRPATEARVVEISRAGEPLGVRTIQTSQGAATMDLVGAGDWRANTRWVIGHAAATEFSSRIVTQSQSIDRDVSLLGLPVGHAAVIVEGRVLTPDAAMAMATPAAIAEAMAGVAPAQLHPADREAAGYLWEATAAWTEQEAGTDD
jgi:hypothetical protein